MSFKVSWWVARHLVASLLASLLVTWTNAELAIIPYLNNFSRPSGPCCLYTMLGTQYFLGSRTLWSLHLVHQVATVKALTNPRALPRRSKAFLLLLLALRRFLIYWEVAHFSCLLIQNTVSSLKICVSFAFSLNFVNSPKGWGFWETSGKENSSVSPPPTGNETINSKGEHDSGGPGREKWKM